MRRMALVAVLLVIGCEAPPPAVGGAVLAGCDGSFTLENRHRVTMTRFDWRPASSSIWSPLALPPGGLEAWMEMPRVVPPLRDGTLFRATWQDGTVEETQKPQQVCGIGRLSMRPGDGQVASLRPAAPPAPAPAPVPTIRQEPAPSAPPRQPGGWLAELERELATRFAMPAQERWPGALATDPEYRSSWYFTGYGRLDVGDYALLWNLEQPRGATDPHLARLANFRLPHSADIGTRQSILSTYVLDCKRGVPAAQIDESHAVQGARGGLLHREGPYFYPGPPPDRGTTLGFMVALVCERARLQQR